MKERSSKTKAYRLLGLVTFIHLAALPFTASGAGYHVRALVSNLPGVADHTDANALNSWGLVIDPVGTLIVAQNHANLASFYGADGQPFPFTIDAEEAPTGMLLNRSGDFVIK